MSNYVENFLEQYLDFHILFIIYVHAYEYTHAHTKFHPSRKIWWQFTRISHKMRPKTHSNDFIAEQMEVTNLHFNTQEDRVETSVN